ncbi:MAG: diphosphomevalonate decarboxylase [archaeon]
MKATAIAQTNIAFIKYWGKKDELLKIPQNGSISMNLSNLNTTTTVEFNNSLSADYVEIENLNDEKSVLKIVAHLDLIRNLAKIKYKAKVKSKNNFPSGTGLSSSASGFAALTVAACAASGLSLNEKELSIIARQGSGSACRSIPDGFVEWFSKNGSESSYAKSIYPPDYWNICDVVAIVSNEKKETSSTAGQTLAKMSPFYKKRLSMIATKIKIIKKLIKEKKFKEFGELCEAEALEMHAVMLTSNPPLIYWQPETLRLMKQIRKWRTDGLFDAYFTINTGQDVHVLCLEKDASAIKDRLSSIDYVKEIIVNKPSYGTRLIEKPLF